ncbi:MAG TPA: hypothetical protein PKJ76_08710 [Flexilinea sp.]|nr:hypothetical protein [Flexilinea sp.]
MQKFQPKQMLREWLGIHEPLNDVEFVAGMRPIQTNDLPPLSIQEVIAESQKAWRENPLAHRIISITTQYVIGKGVTFKACDSETQCFLRTFWDHPLNKMDLRIHEWNDELSRSGNLFILISSDVSGMSYVRAIPAARIHEIRTRDNDCEQVIAYKVIQPTPEFLYDEKWIQAADRLNPTLDPVMIHFAVNRSIGSIWGEPDLAPLLKWLSRYANWLEDRVRLNRYRNSFLFVVRTHLVGEAQRLQRQSQLNSIPPVPGSILVTNENEEWSVLSPKLESMEAKEDGLALKKMIAAGAGIPLHFLAEPESENKASAESAGESTCRHFEQRQQLFLNFLTDLLQQVLSRAALVNSRVQPDDPIWVSGDDISVRDNLTLSQAGLNIVEVLSRLKTQGFLSNDEFLRITYRFIGEELKDENKIDH